MLIAYALLSLPYDLPRWPPVRRAVEWVNPAAKTAGISHSFRFFQEVGFSTFEMWAEVTLDDGTKVRHDFDLGPAAIGTYGNTDRFLVAVARDKPLRVDARAALARSVGAAHPGAVEVRLIRETRLLADPDRVIVDVIHVEEL